MAIKDGDNVKVHYRGTLDDGSEFDCSHGREPLAFVMGQGQLIKGFEKALFGLEVGDKVTTHILAAEAYGEHDPDQVLPMQKELFPEDMELVLGMELQLQTETGMLVNAVVKEITDSHVILDVNHPLAGQNLNFEIEVVEIG